MGKLLGKILPPITNAEEANHAVRMAGLPAFLIGLSIAISGLAMLLGNVFYGQASAAGPFVQFAIGVAFVVISFRLRKGLPGFVPVVFFLTALNFLVEFLLADTWQNVLTIFRLTITAVMLLMTVNGLRAWNWSRRTRVNSGG